MHSLSISLQALVAASVFFVWVVRYDNIVKEFERYGLPDAFRHLVGIPQLTFSLLLLIGVERPAIALVGALGISILMACAFATHLRVKSQPVKMLPSLSLLVVSLAIASINYPLIRQ